MNHVVELSFEEQKNKGNEKFRPMPACADCAGWHGSKLFTEALTPIFAEHGSYIKWSLGM